MTEQPTGDPFAVWIPPQDSSPRRLWEVDMSVPLFERVPRAAGTLEVPSLKDDALAAVFGLLRALT